MLDSFCHLAYFAPSGFEFLLVMLVLLVLFGTKDAPRIMRKLNEIINQIRNVADGFRREVMYGDFDNDTSSGESFHFADDDNVLDAEYDYDSMEAKEELTEAAEQEPVDDEEGDDDAQKA